MRPLAVSDILGPVPREIASKILNQQPLVQIEEKAKIFAIFV
jgi:hypothetical protein